MEDTVNWNKRSLQWRSTTRICPYLAYYSSQGQNILGPKSPIDMGYNELKNHLTQLSL